jgi:hypothetical protein
MSRRSLTVLAVTIAAALGFAAIGAFAFSGRGHGSWGYGMMGRYTGDDSAVLLIRHQRAHCHTWSLNGGPFKAAQTLSLKAGSSLTIIDNDVMPHRLIKLSGPAVRMRNGTVMPMMGGYVSQTPGLMNHMGARTRVTFKSAGVYRFRTKAGEDFMPGIETTGADNVLTLVVTVSA